MNFYRSLAEHTLLRTFSFVYVRDLYMKLSIITSRYDLSLQTLSKLFAVELALRAGAQTFQSSRVPIFVTSILCTSSSISQESFDNLELHFRSLSNLKCLCVHVYQAIQIVPVADSSVSKQKRWNYVWVSFDFSRSIIIDLFDL